MNKTYNWAIAGTGWIASDMAEILKKHGRSFTAVVSGHRENAENYARKYNIPHVYDTLAELCADPSIDVLYIATPHNTHYEIAKQALQAGKHCLIEKSITLNSRELEELVALADQNNLCLAEAMTTWHMPVMKELKKIVDSGELGKVRVVNACFGSLKPYDMENRFFSLKTAGGALLDIGVYALSAIRLFLDSKPTEISSQWTLCAAGSDEQESLLLKNADAQMATALISLHAKQPKRVTVSCENAFIEIMEYPRAQKAEITNATTGEKTVLTGGETAEALYYEVQDFEETITQSECTDTTSDANAEARDMNAKMSGMHLQYTRENMEVMTALRKEWNMKYPGEIW